MFFLNINVNLSWPSVDIYLFKVSEKNVKMKSKVLKKQLWRRFFKDNCQAHWAWQLSEKIFFTAHFDIFFADFGQAFACWESSANWNFNTHNYLVKNYHVVAIMLKVLTLLAPAFFRPLNSERHGVDSTLIFFDLVFLIFWFKGRFIKSESWN